MSARVAVGRALAAVLALTATASAAPLDDPYVGGFGFNGPTNGGLAAIYWNPAALGLTRGNHATFALTGMDTRTTIDRSAIDPATGLPGGMRSFAPIDQSDRSSPLIWPAGPGGFAGVSTDFGGDRVALGLATYMPFFERGRTAAQSDGNLPTRYHRVDVDMRNLALVPALAIRITGDLRIGFAPGFLFSVGRLSFDEDTALPGGARTSDCGGPCGVENPLAAARYKVASGLSPLDSALSFTMAGGVFYRLDRFDIGVSYQSRPLGTAGGGVAIEAPNTRIELPVAAPFGGGTLPCPAAQPDGCVHAEMRYGLPDVFIAGVGFRPVPGWELTASARYLNFSLHDRIDIRLVGSTLEQSGLAQHVALYRGFHDVVDMRLRAAHSISPRVRVGAGIRIETLAVPAAATTPNAVDGLKLEPSLLIEARPLHWLTLSGGYALALMADVDTGASVFDPSAAGACTAAGGDLATDACRTRANGAARPTAAGTYGRTTHRLGLSASARF